MQDTPTLTTARTRLRAFRPSDLQERRDLGKDPAIIRMFGGSPDFDAPVPMTLAEAEAWYDAVSSDPNPLHWAVEHDVVMGILDRELRR